MERIGVYGGSFNPPHIGHINAADWAVDALGLSKMLVIPCNISPGKPTGDERVENDQRVQMLRLALADHPELELCTMQLERGGVSYTCDTLDQLRQQYPDAELVLCMGSDAFTHFESWKEPKKILQTASLAVFHRGKRSDDLTAVQQRLEAMGAKIYVLENPVTHISSTQLRRMLAFRCADPFLQPKVAMWIQLNNLYGTGINYRHLPMDKLEQVVVSLLKPNRVAHVLGCRDTAIEMAKRWGVDETDAARAGILHDITKALDGPLQLTLCHEYGIVLDEFSTQNPKTLHALTGSLVAERIFGESAAVVDAIRWHTTGKANMSLLQKIIYVADYMEPNRDFPGVEKLRHLAFVDIDAALKLGLEMTLDLLRQHGREISPESQQAVAWLERK